MAAIEWKRCEAPRQPALFVNPRSGAGAGPRIAAEARRRSIPTAEFGPDRSLAQLVDDALAAGADALAVAGGDGSLATVAAAACTHDLPFVCVPAGTRNHFARDVGLDPADPMRALDALSDGLEARIDLGEVNGRCFLNNVSLGLYGEAVQQPGYRDAKLRTLHELARAVHGSGVAVPALDLVDDIGESHLDPAIVLVSNNPYALSGPFSPGGRPTLTAGVLGVLVIDRPGVKTGRPPARAWRAASLRVGASGRLHAGLDGEAIELEPPLELAARPAALRVRAPRERARRPAVRALRPAARARGSG